MPLQRKPLLISIGVAVVVGLVVGFVVFDIQASERRRIALHEEFLAWSSANCHPHTAFFARMEGWCDDENGKLVARKSF